MENNTTINTRLEALLNVLDARSEVAVISSKIIKEYLRVNYRLERRLYYDRLTSNRHTFTN